MSQVDMQFKKSQVSMSSTLEPSKLESSQGEYLNDALDSQVFRMDVFALKLNHVCNLP